MPLDPKLDDWIDAQSEKHDLDPVIFRRLLGAESRFDQKAVSPKGAIGHGQLMPVTAKMLGVDPNDPFQNVEGSARYLRMQLDEFKEYPKAIAAYNAGPVAVRKYGGIPPYKETQAHVAKILDPPKKVSLEGKGVTLEFPSVTPMKTIDEAVRRDYYPEQLPGAAKTVASEFVSGLGGALAGPIEQLGIAGAGISQHVPPSPIQYQDTSLGRALQRADQQFNQTVPESTGPFKLGQSIRDFADNLIDKDPIKADSWYGKLARGLGTTVPMLFAGKIPLPFQGAQGTTWMGASRAFPEIPLIGKFGLDPTAALMGSTSSSAEMYRRVREGGGSIDDSMKASKLSALAGLSEGLPISRAIDRFDHFTGGGLRKILVEGGKGALEEGGQEFFQQIADNFSYKITIDEAQEILQGSGEAFAVGGGVGGIISTIAAAAAGIKLKRAKATGPNAILREDNSIKELDQVQEQEAASYITPTQTPELGTGASTPPNLGITPVEQTKPITQQLAELLAGPKRQEIQQKQELEQFFQEQKTKKEGGTQEQAQETPKQHETSMTIKHHPETGSKLEIKTKPVETKPVETKQEETPKPKVSPIAQELARKPMELRDLSSMYNTNPTSQPQAQAKTQTQPIPTSEPNWSEEVGNVDQLMQEEQEDIPEAATPAPTSEPIRDEGGVSETAAPAPRLPESVRNTLISQEIPRKKAMKTIEYVKETYGVDLDWNPKTGMIEEFEEDDALDEDEEEFVPTRKQSAKRAEARSELGTKTIEQSKEERKQLIADRALKAQEIRQRRVKQSAAVSFVRTSSFESRTAAEEFLRVNEIEGDVLTDKDGKVTIKNAKEIRSDISTKGGVGLDSVYGERSSGGRKETTELHSFNPLWYSKMNDEVAKGIKSMPKVMTGDEFKRQLKILSQNNKPGRGFKWEEFEDTLRLTNFGEWLDAWEGKKIPRERLQEELLSNQIEVEELSSSYAPRLTSEDFKRLNVALKTFDLTPTDETYETFTRSDGSIIYFDSIPYTAQNMVNSYLNSGEMDTKYAPYQYPNYNLRGDYEGYIELVLWSPQAREMTQNDPSHWIEGEGKRQIGWIRGKGMGDTFLIEEMQSKRHQEGADDGYQGEVDPRFRQRIKELEEALAKLEDKRPLINTKENITRLVEAGWSREYADAALRRLDILPQVDTLISDNNLSNSEATSLYDLFYSHPLQYWAFEYDSLNRAIDEAYKKAAENERGVPDAPFRKSHTTLFLRRAIKWAVENGYKKLAWTTGEQQAERWSLRQAAEYMTYDQDSKLLIGSEANGFQLWSREISPEDLSGYVGKEFAQELLANKSQVDEEELHRRALTLFKGELDTLLEDGKITSEEYDDNYNSAKNDFGHIPPETIAEAKRELRVSRATKVPKGVEFYASKWPEKIYGFKRSMDKSVISTSLKDAMAPFKAERVEVGSGDSLTEFSAQPGVEFTDEQIEFFTNNPMMLYSFNPLSMTRKSLGKLKERLTANVDDPITKQYVDDQIGALGRTLGQPWWLVKDKPLLGELIGITRRRLSKFTHGFSKSIDTVKPYTELSEEKQRVVRDIMWPLDGVSVPGLEDKYELGADEKITGLKSSYKSTYETFIKTKTNDPEVLRAITSIRFGLDEDLAAKWNLAREFKDVDNKVLTEIRKETFSIPNYLPHSRFGDYVLVAYDAKGKKVLDTAFDLSRLIPGKIGKMPIGEFIFTKFAMNQMQKKLLDDPLVKQLGPLQWRWDKRKGIGDEHFISQPVLASVLNDVIEKTANSITDPALARAIRDSLPQAMVDSLKGRGDWGHLARRKGIYGFEQDNLGKVLYNYKYGMHALVAKTIAMREFTDQALKIRQDKTMGEGDKRFTTQYISDMLEPHSKFESAAYTLKTLAALKYIGGSVKSGVVNILTAPHWGVVRLTSDTGLNAVKYMTKALDKTMRYMISGKGLDASRTRLMEELFADGTTQNQIIEDLGLKLNSNSKLDPISSRWIKTILAPMTLTERYSRMSTAMAAFDAATSGSIRAKDTLAKYELEAGKEIDPTNEENFQKLKSYAEDVVLDSHGMFGKGNRPAMVRTGRIGKLAETGYVFRHFAQNTLHLNKWLARRGLAGNRDAWKALAYALGGQALLGGIAYGTGFQLLRELWKKLFGDDLQDKLRDTVEGQTAKDLLTYGIFSLAGTSITSSISPDFPSGIEELIGVPASLAKDLGKAKDAYDVKDYWKMFEAVATPKILRDISVGHRLNTQGMTNSLGAPINVLGEDEPLKISKSEMAKQFLGFGPLKVQKMREIDRELSSLEEFKLSKQDEFANRYVRAARAEDDEEIDRILEELDKWNDKILEAGQDELLIDLSNAVKNRSLPSKPPKALREKALELSESYGLSN